MEWDGMERRHRVAASVLCDVTDTRHRCHAERQDMVLRLTHACLRSRPYVGLYSDGTELEMGHEWNVMEWKWNGMEWKWNGMEQQWNGTDR